MRAPRVAARHRSTLLVALGLVAGLAVVVLLGPRGTGNREPYDPENAGADGARALARVLADHDVRREVARSADELDGLSPGSDSVVVVTSPDRLGASTAGRLERAATQARIVLLDPAPATLALFGVDGSPATARLDGPVTADCDADPFADLLEGLSVRVDSANAYPGPGCFRTGTDALLTSPRPGLVLLGAPQLLTNDQILRADNAAVALRLLGSAERVVWYSPDLADLGGDDAVSIGSLLPRWLGPSVVLTLLGLVALLLWRVRRFGPLAVEALPVEVVGTETVLARGRMYLRSGDRTHSALVLQRRGLESARRHLQLTGVADEVVAAAVAAHVEREVGAVRDLLLTPPAVPTDASLTALADALADLDREVRTR